MLVLFAGEIVSSFKRTTADLVVVTSLALTHLKQHLIAKERSEVSILFFLFLILSLCMSPNTRLTCAESPVAHKFRSSKQ